jgi:archaetidylinositol phosphate synthase
VSLLLALRLSRQNSSERLTRSDVPDMSQRISHSLLDPYLTIPAKRQYHRLRIPASLPPEAIVGTGHACAIAGAVGLAFSTSTWWGGLLAAAGVVGNHYCDVFDGTHARATGQCRNGGELLDHFCDPLSFAYCLVGIAISCGRLDLGLAAVIILFATAVLTNIKAKITGEFTLSAFGPTEFKALLTVYALILAGCVAAGVPGIVTGVTWAFGALIVIGVIQLVHGLVTAVNEVNAHGSHADTTEWVTTRESQPVPPAIGELSEPLSHPTDNAERLDVAAPARGRCPR